MLDFSEIKKRCAAGFEWKFRGCTVTIDALLILCVIVYGLGVLWRGYYILNVHPPQNHVYSDMQMYVSYAFQLLNPHYVGSIADTYQSPGTSYYIATLLYWGKNNMMWPATGQFVLSSLVPLLMGATGWLAFGRRLGLLAVIVGSFYFPFVDYFGFFLSEGPFLVAMLAWMIAVLSMIHTRSRAVVCCVWGGFAAVFFVMALAFKGHGLIPGILVFCALIVWSWRNKQALLMRALRVAGITALIVVQPLVARATRLNEGRFAFISTNAAPNILMGHYGDVGLFTFRDAQRNMTHAFGNPVFAQRHYAQKEYLPFGVYDTKASLEYMKRRMQERPGEVLMMSIRNVSDLFEGSIPWPAVATPQRWYMILSEIFFKFGILFPAFYFVVRHHRKLVSFKGEDSLKALILFLPLVGLMITAFISASEPRYRIPFDGFTILLALAACTKAKLTSGRWL